MNSKIINVQSPGKAVLLIVFNRLDPAKQVFEKIRIAKPPRFYLASDGARFKRSLEREIVTEIRKWLLQNIDWDCEVYTLFRDKNLGCGKAVSSAITWFFSYEKEGIILEDDCLPSNSFFGYCEILLDKYKDNKKIWHISGDNPLVHNNCEGSYYFVKVQHCWGWATWADRWKHYNFNMKEYNKEDIKLFSKKKDVQKYWLNILKLMNQNKIDTWDYQWTFAIIINKGICINPKDNMISNIGNSGTHYDNQVKNPRLNAKRYELDKVIHPNNIIIDTKAVDAIYNTVFGIKKPTIIGYVARIIKYILRKIYDKLNTTNRNKK